MNPQNKTTPEWQTERHRRNARNWARRNRARVSAKSAEWAKANPDRWREIDKRSRAGRVAAINEATGRYRAAKSMAAPAWLTARHRRAIRAFYRLAEQRSIETGVPHHVDHLCPLRGEAVCGLHVPWNLQVLTQSENVRKSNRLLQRLGSENSSVVKGADQGRLDCSGTC
jgi:5-methylcytosine-specific restriction endonuclease McrA